MLVLPVPAELYLVKIDVVNEKLLIFV